LCDRFRIPYGLGNYPYPGGSLRAQRLSVHGIHSERFCHHAKDPEKEIVLAYMNNGCAWFELTEHMRAVSPVFPKPQLIKAEAI
jgi:hypothetical protein